MTHSLLLSLLYHGMLSVLCIRDILVRIRIRTTDIRVRIRILFFSSEADTNNLKKVLMLTL
jgi:hypothetical protein